MKRTLLILWFGSMCASTFGQTDSTGILFPSLNGHKAMNLSNCRSPFIKTQLYMHLEVGNSAIFSVPGLEVGDTTVLQLTNELLYTRLGIGYQQRIKDWISFYGRFEYGARLGADVATLLIEGVNSIESIEFGVTFKISEGQKHVLSGYLKSHNVIADIIDVKQFVIDIINDDERAAVQKTVPALNAGGGLLFYAAPYSYLGINADAQLSYGEPLLRGGSTWLYNIGGSIDFSFNDWINAPITLVVGGNLSTIPNIFSIDGDLTSTFQLKMAYNKSPDYSISLEYYNGQSPISDSDRRVNIKGIIIGSVFYF